MLALIISTDFHRFYLTKAYIVKSVSLKYRLNKIDQITLVQGSLASLEYYHLV